MSYPEIKEYTKQQHHVGLPHFFNSLDSEEQSYWFGLIDRDGFLTNPEHYKVGIELQRRDRILLERFAKIIKLDLNKCKIRDFTKEHNKGWKKYEMSGLYVCCKPLFNDLIDIGLSNLKTSREFVPKIIKTLVFKAKEEAEKFNVNWNQVKEGKIALTWLLGCYDGDGSYVGKKHNWKSGVIYSSSKLFLIDIKRVFGIKNNIITTKKPGSLVLIFGKHCITKGVYSLSLGSNLLEIMWKTFPYSLARKRPNNNI